MKRLIYNFKNKQTTKFKHPKNILGGKGANLAEMGNMGFPVPDGFTISTDVCDLFYKNNESIPTIVINQVKSLTLL